MIWLFCPHGVVEHIKDPLEHTLNNDWILVYVAWYNFFLISEERRQASGGFNDIPTRLAPRETSFLCRHSQEILLKKRKIITKEGGTRPKPFWGNENEKVETVNSLREIKVTGSSAAHICPGKNQSSPHLEVR